MIQDFVFRTLLQASVSSQAIASKYDLCPYIMHPCALDKNCADRPTRVDMSSAINQRTSRISRQSQSRDTAVPTI